MMNGKVKRWEVYEDNAGTLHLVVFGYDEVLYYNYGYEQEKGILSGDIQALESGDDPTLWDGNKCNLFNQNDFDYGDVIVEHFRWCEYTLYNWNKMGKAGHYEFD